jgi:hypothetical protein
MPDIPEAAALRAQTARRLVADPNEVRAQTTTALRGIARRVVALGDATDRGESLSFGLVLELHRHADTLLMLAAAGR